MVAHWSLFLVVRYYSTEMSVGRLTRTNSQLVGVRGGDQGKYAAIVH